MAINKVFFYIIFIICGLAMGSFLGVVAYRLPRKLSIIKPRSFCPHCKREIPFYDNIPVISYIILKGRCRYCKKRIPLNTLLIEVITAMVFVLNYIFFGLSIKTISGIILCSILVLISFIDIEFQIIPNVIIFPFALVGLAFSIFLNLKSWWMPFVYSAGAFLFMLIIHLIYPRGMGMGDVKLSFLLGAYLVRNVVPALFLGFLAGAIYGVLLIIIKKRKLRHVISFGPFISIGSIIALFCGDNILKWYVSFLK
jgi:leader peptidase (prepilin peptidase) / N-methyltransferase